MQKIITFLVGLLIGFLLGLPFYVGIAFVEAPIMPKMPEIKEYAEKRINDTFGSGWLEFEAIINAESRWEVWGEHYPISKKSTAMGACGFLNGTWEDLGIEKTEDPYKQIDACLVYAEKRYGTLENAWKFHRQNNWW